LRRLDAVEEIPVSTNKLVCTSGWDDYEDRITAALNKLCELGLIQPADQQNSDITDAIQPVWQPTGFGLDVIECMTRGMSDDDMTEIVNAAAGI
jgi:hypothetical protein